MSQNKHDELLLKFLANFLGEVGAGTLDLLRKHAEWLQLAAGDTLMRQGELGESMYLTISGRLRVYVAEVDGTERVVGELVRGQIIGEMSMYMQDARSATVVAIRNSVLVRLSREHFSSLLKTDPEVSVALTRQIIQRLRNVQMRPAVSRPVTICVVPITGNIGTLTFSQSLAAHLSLHGRVKVVNAEEVDLALGREGLARSATDNAETSRLVSMHLDALEASHEFLLLVADDTPTGWTQRCSRSCDEVLLLADQLKLPALHQNETRCLMARAGRPESRETLVFLHDEGLVCPKGTREWLARRPVADHFHIRPTLPRDMRRLARILSGTAIGLVMAGGGARGFAHLGVLQALQEKGIEIDFVGGTSIGSVMAMFAGSDRPLSEVMRIARKCFSSSPTRDFNLIPLMSLVVGRRLKKIMRNAIKDLVGHEADIEDLWKNYFCIATNYSQACEQVLVRGSFLNAMMASTAIPGALPPVLMDGELMCDGGTFNNFPVDVMRRRTGIGLVIGIDLNPKRPKRLELSEMPSRWALLLDKLRPRRSRKFHLPSIFTLLVNATLLYSISRQRESILACDLYFNPPLERLGLMQWDRFDPIVQQGLEHGRAVLKSMTEEKLSTFGTGRDAECEFPLV